MCTATTTIPHKAYLAKIRPFPVADLDYRFLVVYQLRVPSARQVYLYLLVCRSWRITAFFRQSKLVDVRECVWVILCTNRYAWRCYSIWPLPSFNASD